jgi:methyl-accepting chemotaxis protein
MAALWHRLRHPGVSTRLSGAVILALFALCVMGTIAVLATERVRDLGDARYEDGHRVATAQLAISVSLERAISDVHAAPSELDLKQLQARREHFQALLSGIPNLLHGATEASADAAVQAAAARIAGAIDTFAAAGKQVFDFAASFAQPDAIAAVANRVAPAEATLQAALGSFEQAATARSLEADDAIHHTADTITRIVVALAALLVLAIAVMSYLTVSRGVVRPIVSINGVMQRLSGGEHDVAIPHSARVDEIGDMARAVAVFKQHTQDIERLAAEQGEARAAREARQAAMGQHTRDFGSSISGVMTALAESAAGMRRAAGAMADAASAVHTQAAGTSSNAAKSSQDLTAVAAAVEELTSSVGEISRQVTASADVSQQAVQRAEASHGTMQGLAEATSRIGDVVHLISDIAGQTNLLALNATIEAARAGDAGKGFAVVAGEVKSLATQTAKATAEIGGQIERMRSATADALAAMTEIGGFIGRMNEVSAAIAAAVEQQNATTREIAGSVQAVSQATAATAQAMAHVVEVAETAGDTSRDLLSGAGDIGREAETLRAEVGQFLTQVLSDGGQDGVAKDWSQAA